MKISELQTVLAAALAEHGDLEVEVDVPGDLGRIVRVTVQHIDYPGDPPIVQVSTQMSELRDPPARIIRAE